MSPLGDAAPMGDWKWADRGWHERVGTNPGELAKEALRRAVDIRDTGTTTRAVMLVDVLNALCDELDVDTSNLWAI